MTRVPPVNQNQRSNDSGEGPKRADHKKEKQKEFKLPEKGDGVGQGTQEAKLSSQQAAQAESAKTEKAAGLEASKMANINGLISKMVDSMQIGKVGGTDLLQAQLKESDDVPDAFKGATVKIEMGTDGLKVFIQPLPGHEDQAAALIAEHKDQALELQKNLAAKGYALQHLQVGEHVAELPKERVTPLSELFSNARSSRERGDEQRQGPERVEPDREA